ncbi:2-hydroxyacid dehydrogenase [Acidiphilium sp. PA]|uniref:2-hydroxyacid dehydrogenase n=1 Tax=Acidiphilium sp. PA TaxID=2871705 RepID=UPI002244AE0F|nr:2-hydroxyacid dehydrogenase [Acidiphilium sp. PA]MCW8307921.1 2-hydroxyacid dehydrogenase [Acidiphilium sp. PA]
MSDPIWRCAVIADDFMLPAMFEAAIHAACGAAVTVRSMQLPWPDQPMVQASEAPALAGIKEFLGDPDDIASFIGESEIVVTHLAPLSASVIARLPRLRLIGSVRGGPVNIDRAAATARGIAVVNTPGRNASAVAEFTVGCILAQTRQITVAHEGMRQRIWRGDLYRADRTGRELRELTVGIVGYGQIGRRVVKLLAPFGCRIIVADPYATLAPEDAAAGVTLCPLPTLLASADVITLHPRVTPETTNMIDAAAIATMRRGAIIINTTRGAIIDYAALTAALASGQLGGAALDCYSIEPPPDDWALLDLPNVTLTPHIAGASLENVRVATSMIATEIHRFITGLPPLHPC